LHSKPNPYSQQKFADNCLLGKQIVSASADKNLKLWDLAGNCLQTFVGHTAEDSSVNFSPDGKQIVSASWGRDNLFAIWTEICTQNPIRIPNKSLAGNCLQTFVGHTDEVWSANFSPDGKQIVSASWDKSLKLWDLAGNCLQTFVGTKVCRQLPAKSQSLRLLSIEAETICLPSGLKFALQTLSVCPTKVCRQLPAKSQ
jgi:WD40 repeat protein